MTTTTTTVICVCCAMATANADVSGCEYSCGPDHQHELGHYGTSAGQTTYVDVEPDPYWLAYPVACHGCETPIHEVQYHLIIVD